MAIAPSPTRAVASDAAALKAAVMRLMADFSIEITPGEMLKMASLPAVLRPASRVYVTWIQGGEFARTVATCARLRDAGMVPVPHLAARAIGGAAQLDAMLGELHRVAGVDHALVIGGSLARPVGDFDSAASLLSSGLFEQHRFKQLGVGAHPEGSPGIAAPLLDEALRHKREHARRSGTPMHIVTQFCFAAQPIVRWEHAARSAGNALPVHVGLPGLASLPALVKYARHCGVGASLGALTKRGASMLKLVSAVAPSETVVALARSVLADPPSRIERCHFFPFGSFHATAAWAAALAEGAFTLSDDGHDPMFR